MRGAVDAVASIGLVVACAAAVAVVKTSPSGAARTWLAATLASWGAAIALGAPSVVALAASLPWGLAATGMTKAGLQLAAGCCVVAMLIAASSPGRSARRPVVVQALALVAFLLAFAVVEVLPGGPAAPGRPEAGGVAAVVMFVASHAYLGVAFVGLALLARRVALQPELTRETRWGLRTTQAAAVIGVCYVVSAAATSPQAVGTAASLIDTVLMSVSAIALAAGATLTAWLPTVRLGWLNVKILQARWRLRPLCRLVRVEVARLHEGLPVAAFVGPAGTRALFRLLLHVIAIRDAQQSLSRHVDAEVRRRVRLGVVDLSGRRGVELGSTDARLLGEAAELAVALDIVKSTGCPAATAQPAASNPAVRLQPRGTGDDCQPVLDAAPDVLAEARRLHDIYRAVRYSRIVARARDQAGDFIGTRRATACENCSPVAPVAQQAMPCDENLAKAAC